jgi:DNA polymerase-3 subunit alpha
VEELYCLAERHPGPHPLQLQIRSKLADVVIESKIHVSRMLVEEAKALGVSLVEPVEQSA